MNVPLKIPPFGKFLDQLQTAGVETKSSRGFWGGVTPESDIVVTSWTDEPAGNGGFSIHRPKTDHGGLKTVWEVGNIRVGAEVRMILIRQRGNIPRGTPGRTVKDAALLPGKWRVVKMVSDQQAVIERCAYTMISIPFYQVCSTTDPDLIYHCGQQPDAETAITQFNSGYGLTAGKAFTTLPTGTPCADYVLTELERKAGGAGFGLNEVKSIPLFETKL